MISLYFNKNKLFALFYFLLILPAACSGGRENYRWEKENAFPIDESNGPIYRGIQDLLLKGDSLYLILNYRELNVYDSEGRIVDSFNIHNLDYLQHVEKIERYKKEKVYRDSTGMPVIKVGSISSLNRLFRSKDDKIILSYTVKTESRTRIGNRNITHGRNNQFLSEYRNKELQDALILEEKDIYKQFKLVPTTMKGFWLGGDTLYLHTLKYPSDSTTFPILARFVKTDSGYKYQSVYASIRYPLPMHQKYNGTAATVFMVKEINGHIYCSNGLELFNVSGLKRVWHSGNNDHYLYDLSYCDEAGVFIGRILDSEKKEFYFQVMNESFAPIDTLDLPPGMQAVKFDMQGCRMAFISKNNEGYEANIYRLHSH